MEARGEIRGGRFVSGFVGEQFARPEAVAALRAMRRDEDRGGGLVISTSDPLNLAGIILPGPRVSGLSGGDVQVLEPAELSAAAS
jgi:ATP-dependent Lhr-like helicase